MHGAACYGYTWFSASCPPCRRRLGALPHRATMGGSSAGGPLRGADICKPPVLLDLMSIGGRGTFFGPRLAKASGITAPVGSRIQPLPFIGIIHRR